MLSHTGATATQLNKYKILKHFSYDYFQSRINIGFADIVQYLHRRLKNEKDSWFNSSSYQVITQQHRQTFYRVIHIEILKAIQALLFVVESNEW